MTKKFQEIKKLGKVVFFLIDLLYIELRPHQVALRAALAYIANQLDRKK